jgi:hypothetical protein
VEYVTITGIFENVLESKFKFQCSDEDLEEVCTYSALEEKFTIDENLISVIVQMIVQEMSILQGNKEKDNQNNQTQDEANS